MSQRGRRASSPSGRARRAGGPKRAADKQPSGSTESNPIRVNPSQSNPIQSECSLGLRVIFGTIRLGRPSVGSLAWARLGRRSSAPTWAAHAAFVSGRKRAIPTRTGATLGRPPSGPKARARAAASVSTAQPSERRPKRRFERAFWLGAIRRFPIRRALRKSSSICLAWQPTRFESYASRASSDATLADSGRNKCTKGPFEARERANAQMLKPNRKPSSLNWRVSTRFGLAALCM